MGGVDFTSPSDLPAAGSGTGTAALTLQTLPDTIVLERTDFGAGTYYMNAEDGLLEVETVEGNPYVEYLIRIPELEFADDQTYFPW